MTTQPSILVVDDEKDTCANLQDILMDLGYHVDVAYDGFSALELLEKHPYDVTLLDLKMPGMNGVELYRRIKKLRADTVAIIVTAYATSDTAEMALGAGALEILPKPVDFPRLMSLVDDVLEQPLLLVVDDDQDLCDNLWDLFHEKAYRVGVAHSLTESRKVLEDRDYKLVLIDMCLEDGGGDELYQMVRKLAPTARTILVTGYRNDVDRIVEKVMGEGADAVCYKPFDVANLLSMVKKLVQPE